MRERVRERAHKRACVDVCVNVRACVNLRVGTWRRGAGLGPLANEVLQVGRRPLSHLGHPVVEQVTPPLRRGWGVFNFLVIVIILDDIKVIQKNRQG